MCFLARRALAWIKLGLMVAALPLSASASNYSDIWWNPSESGWGLTIADHDTNIFAVWYTYRAEGRPVWYTIPGGAFSNGRQFFDGDWTSPNLPYKSRRCQYVTGGGKWHVAGTPRSSSVRRSS
jgi:hypothetical protein